MTETETKIAAAQEAVAKAAALLLEHAEGLAMLAMIESRREPPDHPVVEAYSLAVLSAAGFAGRFEAFQRARDLPSEVFVTLREEIEKLVGDDGGPPPPLSLMPDTAGNAELGITPRQVHAQAWRSHLAASAATVALVRKGYGAL